MPWLSSHLDADSHLGAEPGAQSAADLHQSLMAPGSTPTGSEAAFPAPAPVGTIMGLTKQQWLLIGLAAAITIIILKNRRS